MTDVLISYARKDRGAAARLAASLAERGLKAVWDVSELPEGALMAAAKERARAAPAVIVLWSETSVRSIWVKEEADAAQARGALVSANLDSSLAPVPSQQPIIDLSAWSATGEQNALDALTNAIASAAGLAAARAGPRQPVARADQVSVIPPASAGGAEDAPPSAPTMAPAKTALINDLDPDGNVPTIWTLIIAAFLALLLVAVERQHQRTPSSLPPISMDAQEPLEAPVIVPGPEDENAPSGLRPIPGKPQDSTGSVRK